MTENPDERSAILIIDDDEQIRSLLSELLSTDHDCATVNSAEDALALMKERRFDLVISDINMGGISGLALVPRILAKAPDTVVVMISGQQTIDYAIEAMRVGAFDYVTKPLDLRHVQAAVRRALTHHDLLENKRRYEDHLEDLVRERAARIEHLAYHDRITDLPNRALFIDRCNQALAIGKRRGQLAGVLLVSLDRFKKITDTLGHAAGDVALIEAAARLQSCVCAGDTVARFEGEEFALLLTELCKPGDLADTCLAISDAFKSSFHLGGQELYVTASIGISMFPINGDDSNTIIRNAGAALYRAKKHGGNNYQFYTSDLNEKAVKRLALETSLRRAVTNKEFITYYQPVINFASGRIVGFEALARWQHPELGVLAPSEFIDLAEDTGLILDIGAAIMRMACKQTRKWQVAGAGGLRIAVNVSTRQFQQDFREKLIQILDDTQLDPSSLELEVTETSIMENPESVALVLAEIRQMGVKVAIDDFGTGYSSLSYLKRLPIDTLKLDRSFVNDATTDPDSAAMVMAIVTLAHDLKLRVIAEGVETDEQLAFLRLLRCDEGQGYLFGKPAPADVVERQIFTGEFSVPTVKPMKRAPNRLKRRRPAAAINE